MLNALAQLVLKLASPGVADFFQGTECWDLSLVDPDNRRPVDFAAREAMLEELRRLDCDYAQGYLIGKPQTLAELLAHP